MSTDENLLFGVLALQADLLDAPRFAEACSAWAARKEGPLAELLVERGWLTAEDRADVEKLVRRKLRRHGGDARAGLAEVTTDQILHSLASVADSDVRQSLAELPTHPAPEPEPGSTTAHQPQGRGRYVLANLHAQGGIGQVWLAHDAGLGREVALKELRPERQDHPAARARFLAEARVTGQLEHPGIVPIYELGQGTDGLRPFYTMRFVRGRTFSEAIAAYHQKRKRTEAGPLDLRGLLSAFVAVCNAVAYAHSRGVIHRDLKPANVILGEFGEVMVLDWGLARVVGDAAADVRPTGADGTDRQATLEGQVLGTPAYMAPEQAAGRLADLDARTDTYGLGAILYELLTGLAPFAGQSTEEILSRVRTLAPDRPRDVAPGTAPALEAICTRALLKNPADRYASATALAEDVQHFLADEPTTAYREPLAARAWRRARRHKTLVAGLVAGLLVAVPILAAGLVLLNQSEQRERAARRQEQEARQRAEANYRRSLRAADLLTEELARGVRPIAGTQRQTVVAILDRAREVYDDLLSDPSPPREVLEGRARMLVLFAELYRDTNQVTRSRQAAEQAVALYDRLLTDSPDDRASHLGRGRARNRLGWALGDLGYEDEALAAFRASAAELAANDAERDPVVAARDLASGLTFEGNLLTAFGDHDGAEAAYRRGLEIRRKAAAAARGDPAVRIGLALSLEMFGAFLLKYRNDKAGLALLREGRGELEAVCLAQPWDAESHLHLVRLRTTLARETPDAAEAEACWEANQKVVGRFVPLDPEHVIWQREGLRLDAERIDRKKKAVARLSPAEVDDLRRAETGAREMVLAATARAREQSPEDYIWLAYGAALEARLGNAYLELAESEPEAAPGHRARARQLCLEAVKRYEQLLARSPANVDAADGLIYARYVLAQADEKGDDQDAARASADRYHKHRVAHFERLVERFPASSYWVSKLATAQMAAGQALLDQGRLKEAAALCRAAIRHDPKLAAAHSNLGAALDKQGKMDEAVACYQEALRLDPKLAAAHNNLGFALYTRGKLDEAIARYQIALRLDPKLALAHLNLGVARFQQGKRDEALARFRLAARLDPKLAMAHNNVGAMLNLEGKTDEALASFRLALRHDPKLGMAHNNLGNALLAQGLYDEARQAARAWLKLPPTSGPERTAAERILRLADLGARLPALLAGDEPFKDDVQRIDAAQLIKFRRHYAGAVRLYEEAFAGQPKLAEDPVVLHRYNAACYAALAAAGKAEDAAKLDDKEKARLRAKALAWLRADLALWAKRLDGGKEADRVLVVTKMLHWQQDTDFAGVRGEALAALPELERKAWAELWANVAALLKKAGTK
jgi:tetratricopeptide (TPR) repeat protein/tRNA A-37 threonylcarbamoyl transferase component Bud32